ncbi:MAG: class II aldolase/adducin family protein [Clostridiales bacterium]|nr:class II aldolase/adducin family protein [Clostridiales bacterium]
MYKSDYEIKKEMCEIGRRIYNDGFVAANDGNFSVKIDENTFYVTPTGVSKGFMTPEMICKVDGKGNLKEANGQWRPSSEFKMHLKVYQERPDVNAVVHAHPPIATSFAIAGVSLDKLIMPEAIIFLGAVPIAQYGTPSTMEIPESLTPYLQDYDAILLANHGALTFGCDLNTAFFRMESTEFYAKLLMYSRLIGGEKEIPCGEVKKLIDLRKQFGVPGKHPLEKLCPGCFAGDDTCSMSPTEANDKYGTESSAHYHGFQPLPSQVCPSPKNAGGCTDKEIESIVAEVTKRVLEQYNK